MVSILKIGNSSSHPEPRSGCDDCLGVVQCRSCASAALLSIGAVVVLVVAGMVWALVNIGHRGREVEHIAAAIKPGMTTGQAVAVFPTGFWYASIGVPLRTSICKDAHGHVVPPAEYPVSFPSLAESDNDGEELYENAQKLPFSLDRFESLDRHLRSRKDWDILVNVWTAYIQQKEDHAEPESYFRRGTAYLQHEDFDDGYKDLKTACKLGNQDGCAALERLPKQKVAAFEAEQQRAVANAPACETPVSSFALQQSDNPDEFEVQVYTPDLTRSPPSQPLSRAQVGDLLKREFAGREWGAQFTYKTDFPLRLTFDFVVGRDGRVKCVSPVSSWD